MASPASAGRSTPMRRRKSTSGTASRFETGRKVYHPSPGKEEGDGVAIHLASPSPWTFAQHPVALRRGPLRGGGSLSGRPNGATKETIGCRGDRIGGIRRGGGSAGGGGGGKPARPRTVRRE